MFDVCDAITRSDLSAAINFLSKHQNKKNLEEDSKESYDILKERLIFVIAEKKQKFLYVLYRRRLE